MPAGAGGQRGDRAGHEQLGPGHRVRRVGADHIERAGQPLGQRVAQVVLDDLSREARGAQFPAQVADQVGIAVQHRDGTRPPTRPGVPSEDRQGHADQVVVPQQQDPLPGQRARLVHRQHPAQLGLRRAVGLVQVQLRGRLRQGRPFQRPGQRGGLVRDHHAQAATARAPAGDPVQPGPGCRRAGQAGPSGRSQPHRAGPVHHAALAQLVADGGDERDRQLGSPADLARRDRLMAGDHPEDVGNAGRPLRQPDRGGDLHGYCVNVHG